MGVINLRIDMAGGLADFDCDTCTDPPWSIRLGMTPDQITEGFRLLMQHVRDVHLADSAR